MHGDPKSEMAKPPSSQTDAEMTSAPDKTVTSVEDEVNARQAKKRKRSKLDHGFVGVHIGAGMHSVARTPTYLSICEAACQMGVDVLKGGGTALEAATRATMVLEDAGETNAGYGSNLTEAGTVEMDCGLMDGSSLIFGAVGAMPGIRNPSRVAALLVKEQKKGLLPLGRVPPGFLVGEGAHRWAVRHGETPVNEESLISGKAHLLFKHYKKKLDHYTKVQQQRSQQQNQRSSQVKKRARSGDAPGSEPGNVADSVANFHLKGNPATTATPVVATMDGAHSTPVTESSSNQTVSDSNQEASNVRDIDDGVNDTVGVVVMDIYGNVASTVSSGGIALKQPGRVGQAACFGCGCWAQNKTKPHNLTVGVSTTGCGEHLVRTFLAKECAQHVASADKDPINALKDCMKDKFVQSEFLNGVPEKMGGAICLQFNPETQKGEFLWTHTTASMGLAYQTTACEAATTKMSRLPADAEKGGALILVESALFTTKDPTQSEPVSNGNNGIEEDQSKDLSPEESQKAPCHNQPQVNGNNS